MVGRDTEGGFDGFSAQVAQRSSSGSVGSFFFLLGPSYQLVRLSVAALFQNHQDLLEEFTHFLPDASATYAPHLGYPDRSFAHRDERSPVMPSAREDKVHFFLSQFTETAYMPHAERDFSIDCLDMEHDRQRRNAEKEEDRKEDRDKRYHERDEKELAHDSGDLDNEQYGFLKGVINKSMSQELISPLCLWLKLVGFFFLEKKAVFYVFRFELDMLLESVNVTTKRVEELLEMMQDPIKSENPIHIEDNLTSALLAEIKEINDKMKKEDDIVLSIAAKNRQPIVPNMEFEYVDLDIHEDLYRIIRYSCGEVCTSLDQLDKVIKLWTTFLEPLVGFQPQNRGAEGMRYVKPNCHSGKSSIAGLVKSNETPDADGTGASKESNGGENILSEQAASCRTKLTNGDTTVAGNCFHDVGRATHRVGSLRNNPLQRRVQGSAPKADESSGIIVQNVSAEHFADNTSVVGRTEESHSRTNLETVSGSRATVFLNLNYTHIHFVSPLAYFFYSLWKGLMLQLYRPATVGQTGRSIISVNCGGTAECNKGDRPNEGSTCLNNLKVEREEGELSPNGDTEEDNIVAFEDAAITVAPKGKDNCASTLYQIKPGEVEVSCGEDAEENDADADDEGEESAQRSTEVSENASEAGEDVSGSESGNGEECSHDVHEEEEDDVVHDDQDAKAESEGEAEGMTNVQDAEGEIMSLPFSERFLNTVKPLARHVPAALHDKRESSSRVFYGNDSFYVLLRLHQFEDDCRAIIGTQSYVLFTLDKLIYKVVKQAMNGFQVINGLECKISCSSSKVLD
ncbi:hypothetical protein B296_00012975 [Ensete ventricosum]|uniref:Sin3 C-terminal domain-containing protein n=1 Tax=Ensete ventricosum TaxID=4639 RepID=A0A427AN01_ENSVE|nr:hypothetical protein B296_00012975 [Ensete ventricosum]